MPDAATSPDEYIVCPTCDAAYRLVRPKFAEKAVCARCHTVLITPKRKAGTQIIALALAVCILITAAMFLPFLAIRAGGVTNSISIWGAAFAFDGGIYEPLVVAMIAFLIVIPLGRALILIYVLTPMVLERPIPRGAKTAFGWSESLRPWSMIEIFVLGCAVALIKVADLADIWFGPAFWLFGGLVLLVLAQDSFLCKWSVWNALRHPRKP